MERKLMVTAVGSLVLLAAPLILRAQQQQSSQDQSSQQGDPVVDAARKAREQKKESPKPKKVYTNDDIKPAQPLPGEQSQQPPANSAVPQPSDQAAPQNGQKAQPKDAAAAEGAPDKNDEASWRKRFAAQREKIARAEKELDILQREENKAQVQYYSDPQKALTEQYTRKDINDKAARIAAKQKEIDDLKQELSNLEDQLRQSGGDPGWARP